MEQEYSWPIEPKYKVTEHDKYGIRKNHYVLFKQRAHSGFDITADIGTEVHPIADGTVLLAEFDGTTTEGFDAFNDGYGNKVEILNNDGRRVVYGHLRESYVKPGDKVTRDMVIGITGCSGGSRVPHLHVEVRKSNTDKRSSYAADRSGQSQTVCAGTIWSDRMGCGLFTVVCHGIAGA